MMQVVFGDTGVYFGKTVAKVLSTERPHDYSHPTKILQLDGPIAFVLRKTG